eukprot:GHVS01061363.1.p1 GENE.GHVS01061363.1~~GHVS01061363.1.p1  ORF type:complete len:410 (+),score=27.81 GHVS01061363.1:248-1477(+)
MLLSPLLEYAMLFLGLLVGSSWLIVEAWNINPGVIAFIGSGEIHKGEKAFCTSISKTEFNLFESYSEVTEYETLKDLNDRIIKISEEDDSVVGIRWNNSVLVKKNKNFYGVIKDELSPNAIKLIKSSESFNFFLAGKCDDDKLIPLIKELRGCDLCVVDGSAISVALYRVAEQFTGGFTMPTPVIWDPVLFEDDERAVHIWHEFYEERPTVLLIKEPVGDFWPNAIANVKTESKIKFQGPHVDSWDNPVFPVMLFADEQTAAYIEQFVSTVDQMARYEVHIHPLIEDNDENVAFHLMKLVKKVILHQQRRLLEINDEDQQLDLRIECGETMPENVFSALLISADGKTPFTIRKTDADVSRFVCQRRQAISVVEFANPESHHPRYMGQSDQCKDNKRRRVSFHKDRVLYL